MLKKQTIWLLTMLSLMIVLSVYYIMSPKTNEVAYIDDGEESAEEEASSQADGESDDVDDVDVESDLENDASDDFAKMRLEIQDKRSMEKSRLNDIVASGSASTEEKNEALEEIDVLEEQTVTETILEDSILSENDYQDVLVRGKDDKVHVHVQTDELSNSEVVNIMQMVKDEYGDLPVIVNLKQ